MSVRRCQAEVDSEEFTSWMVFDRLSPIGGERTDINAAHIVQAIVESQGGRRRRLSDYLLEYGPREKNEQADSVAAEFAAIVQSWREAKREKAPDGEPYDPRKTWRKH